MFIKRQRKVTESRPNLAFINKETMAEVKGLMQTNLDH